MGIKSPVVVGELPYELYDPMPQLPLLADPTHLTTGCVVGGPVGARSTKRLLTEEEMTMGARLVPKLMLVIESPVALANVAVDAMLSTPLPPLSPHPRVMLLSSTAMVRSDPANNRATVRPVPKLTEGRKSPIVLDAEPYVAVVPRHSW